jgi:uncharacterized protein (DUF1330 family)
MLCLTLFAARIPHAQSAAAAPAFVVNEIEITDPTGFATYATREGALITRFGGRFLVRGGALDSIAGGSPERVTIYVFENRAQAQAWRDAPEQKELATIRDKSSHFRSFIVEGCSTCAPPNG